MTETDGVLRHLAFFEELGRMEESDASWRSVSAGLVVMRLVDQWIADGPRAMRADSWSVSAVREAIAQVPETTPIKRILGSVVDAMTSTTATDMHVLCPRLMAYGQALEYEAKWTLAADIYTTIVAHSHPVDDSDLAIAAHIQLAFCLRTLGDLDAALDAYHRASDIAVAVDDMLGVLRARLGEAKVAATKGNLPQADAILVDAIDRARVHGLDHIRSQALGDRAYVASVATQWDRAVRYSYEALECVQGQRTKDRILNNIATGFRHLGLLDAARDSYLVLAATAEEQYVRWIAEINLMELAAQQRVELQFDKYRRDLESADFTPQLRVTYLLHVGRGYHALGQSATGIPYLERAIELASRFSLNHLIFEAEEALTQARQHRRVVLERAAEVTPEIQTVVDAVHEMRDLVGMK